MTTSSNRYMTDDPLEDVGSVNACLSAVSDLMNPDSIHLNARGDVSMLLSVLADLQNEAFVRAHRERHALMEKLKLLENEENERLTRLAMEKTINEKEKKIREMSKAIKKNR